ncbi:Integral membrane protein [Streptomyces formicae]|uniref:Integral membrane protein n=1 Tax=Streptomyces formicae TaxID=1616117 RepID=A0A291QFY9_9ACTN|nr:Integral membrane protein [Streptomyces formicae]
MAEGSGRGEAASGLGKGAVRGARVAVGLVFVQIVSLQCGSALAKGTYGQVGPTALAGMRLGFAALVLWTVVRPRLSRLSAAQWRAAAGLGVVFAGMNSAYFQAIRHLPLGVAATLELLGPLALALALSRRAAHLLSGLLALAGVLLLAVPGGALPGVGVMAGAVAALCRAGYVVLNQRVGRLFSGWDGLTVALGIGACLLVPVAGAVDGRSVVEHPALLGTGFLVALLSSLIPYCLDMLALRRIGARAFGVLLALGPAVGTGVGYAALGERLGLREYAAVALVVAAAAWSVRTAE